MSQFTVSSPRKKGSKVAQAKWDDDTTRHFLEVLEEEINSGNRPAVVFSRFGWLNIVTKFKQRTGLDYNKDQLKNRQDNLRREFSKWERLIGKETGLGWDHEKRTLAAPDSWWLEKAKSDPAILKYRDAGPINLDLLQKLFGGITATGYRQYIPEFDVPDPSVSPGYEHNHIDDIMDFTADTKFHATEDTGPMNAPEVSHVPNNSLGISKLASRRKRKRASTDKLLEADKFNIGMESFTVTMKDNMNMYANARVADEVAHDEALNMLNSIPGMGPTNPMFLKAVSVLEDKMKRVAFKNLMEFGLEFLEEWLSGI